MSVYFSIMMGSGRATCRLCHEKIKVTEVQVVAEAYANSGRVHFTCLEKAVRKLPVQLPLSQKILGRKRNKLLEVEKEGKYGKVY